MSKLSQKGPPRRSHSTWKPRSAHTSRAASWCGVKAWSVHRAVHTRGEQLDSTAKTDHEALQETEQMQCLQNIFIPTKKNLLEKLLKRLPLLCGTPRPTVFSPDDLEEVCWDVDEVPPWP